MMQTVPLALISTEEETFRMSFLPDLRSLKASLGAVGILQPVVLLGKETFQIVSGYRRVCAARELGWQEIAAEVVLPEDVDLATGFTRCFYENIASRPFNLIEASLVVNGFLTYCTAAPEAVRDTVLPLLGLQPGIRLLQRLCRLQSLIAEWQVLVVRNEIPLANAAKIADFSAEDQRSLHAALGHLTLGQNKLRQCLEMVEEIVRREEISVERLFASEEFAAIRDNQILNLQERTERFRKTLRTRRYPALTAQEETFACARRALALPSSVSLEPPEYFEGDRLKVSFSFRSREELRGVAKKLEAAAENEALEVLLSML
jgi:hypothetical protein